MNTSNMIHDTVPLLVHPAIRQALSICKKSLAFHCMVCGTRVLIVFLHDVFVDVFSVYRISYIVYRVSFIVYMIHDI